MRECMYVRVYIRVGLWVDHRYVYTYVYICVCPYRCWDIFVWFCWMCMWLYVVRNLNSAFRYVFFFDKNDVSKGYLAPTEGESWEKGLKKWEYLYSCVAFSYTCSCRIHTDAMNNRRTQTSLEKYCTSPFIARVRKGLLKVCGWEGAEDQTELKYFDPHSYGRQRCVFLVLLMLNWRPWGPLCWVLAFFTASYQQLLWSPNSMGVPEGPLGRVWLFLPLSSITPSPTVTGTRTVLTSVLTELYNSSTPTRSLKSHVWSSSSGNNCHAVHRSLSSGASVYKCTMGIFLPRPISSTNFRPRDFLS